MFFFSENLKGNKKKIDNTLLPGVRITCVLSSNLRAGESFYRKMGWKKHSCDSSHAENVKIPRQEEAVGSPIAQQEKTGQNFGSESLLPGREKRGYILRESEGDPHSTLLIDHLGRV